MIDVPCHVDVNITEFNNEPQLIAGALFSPKFSITEYDTNTARYSNLNGRKLTAKQNYLRSSALASARIDIKIGAKALNRVFWMYYTSALARLRETNRAKIQRFIPLRQMDSAFRFRTYMVYIHSIYFVLGAEPLHK